MEIRWPLNKSKGGSVTLHHCFHEDIPIILYEGNEDKLVVMDSRVFAKAYGFPTPHYDMQHIFDAEGMDTRVVATLIKKTATLIEICNSTPTPVVVSKYGWDVMVAMNPAEYKKRAHLFCTGGSFMNKKLVAYFSASGVTAKVAEMLADAVGADIYEIRPEVLYTKADLNWMDKHSRSSVEMNDKSIRPAIADNDARIEQYETIFLGFPIWWYVAPTIINTFLESYDFAGKKIILFATSGGSKFGNTVEELKVSVPDSCEIIEGKLLNGKQTIPSIRSWTETLSL